MQTATADPLVGRRLEGRYRILDRIARGGMSTVYAAVDERLDRLVAVKVMSAALSADPAFSDRFAREARAAARLSHTNAVSVFDQGHEVASDGHHVFLVMELVEGRTLRDLVHERGRLTPAEAVSIMEPVLSALSAAHRAGLVHRDVKPENILLSDEGVVKVADFGLARAADVDTATRTGLLMGTVAYCAPETISKGNADPRSDVYAAGVVLFELLTGRPPFRGDTAMNVAYQHVHSRVPAPSSKVRSLPGELDELVVAATDSDPSGRPADAGDMLAELADVRAQLGLPVTPVPPRARPRKAHRADHRSPDHATTALVRQARAYDTGSDTRVVRERRPANGTTRLDELAPPPPVVIPPRRSRRDRRPAGRGHRRRRSLLVVLLVLALGIGAFFGARAVIAWRFAHVPDVGQDDQGAAVSALRDAGYQARVLPGAEYDPTVPKGEVLRSDPSAGTRFATGKTVTLTLSLGPKMSDVPTVARLSTEAATARLQTVGLGVTSVFRQVSSDTVPANMVIGTTPAAGAQVRTGSAVTLLVSTGPPVIDVPTIHAGDPYTGARKKLERAKFKVVADYATDPTVAAGDVLSVNPTGQATKFSTIDVTVSKGPQMITVPTIAAGTPLSDAVDTLTGLGFDVSTKFAGLTHLRLTRNVVSLDPPAGTSLPLGSLIIVYHS